MNSVIAGMYWDYRVDGISDQDYPFSLFNTDLCS